MRRDHVSFINRLMRIMVPVEDTVWAMPVDLLSKNGSNLALPPNRLPHPAVCGIFHEADHEHPNAERHEGCPYPCRGAFHQRVILQVSSKG